MPLSKTEADNQAAVFAALGGRLIYEGGKVSDQDRPIITVIGRLVDINNKLTIAIKDLADETRD